MAGSIDDGLQRLLDAKVDNAANEWRWMREHNADPAWLDAAVARRCGGEPLAYILGNQEFYGLTLEVNRDVLIPRPETEGIVDAVLARHRERPIRRLLDVGTGSGAIVCAVAANCDIPEIMATDISGAALRVAERNVAALGLTDRIRLVRGHLADPARPAFGTIDCLTANLPYLCDDDREDLQTELHWEPDQAFFSGPDGLHLIRELVQELPELLAPGGLALFEVGLGQADAVVALLRDRGCVDVSATPDLAGIPRVVRAEAPAA